MRKIILFIGAIVLLYFVGLFYWAHRFESETESFLEEALIDIAHPWSAERLESRASWWLREKSKLRPSDITFLANKDYGNLVVISEKPDCNIQQGYDAYSTVKNTYAVCTAKLTMERGKIVMEIRLIQEDGVWKINDFISVKEGLNK